MRRKLAVADDHKFAGIDRADEFGADDVERHGFGREDVRIAQLADDQRTNAERIAAADHAFRGQADQRIGTLDLFQRVDEAIEQGAIVGRGDEVDDDEFAGIDRADEFGPDDVERYVQKFDDGSKATVYRSKELGQAVLVTEGMADPGEGKVYELWLDHDGEMVAAGFMPKGPDNTVLLSGDAAAAEGVGITVEPEGGSDEPNLDTAVVFVFDA